MKAVSIVVVVVLTIGIVVEVAIGNWGWSALFAVLLGLNLWRLMHQVRRSPEAEPTRPDPMTGAVAPDSFHATLAEFAHHPKVREVLDGGPREWTQVALLHDPLGFGLDAEEVPEYVYLGREYADWSLALGDELFYFVDLDVPEDADPVLATLRAHPAIRDAYHEDREVYRTEVDGDVRPEDFAVLAAQALLNGHLNAASRSD